MSKIERKKILDKYPDIGSFELAIVGNHEHAPKFSIYIPTYKRPEKLTRALASAINQQGSCDYEIVIVDNDPSTEELPEELREVISSAQRLRYYKNEKNIGMFGNWNRAISLCAGKWCCALHDDDALKPDYLAIVEEIVDSVDIDELHFLFPTNKESLSSRIRSLLIQIGLGKKKTFLKPVDPETFLMVSGLCPCGAVFKKKSILAHGGFDEDYYPSADFAYTAFSLDDSNVFLSSKDVVAYTFEDNCSSKLATKIGFIRCDYQIRKVLQDRFPKCFTDFWIRGRTRMEYKQLGLSLNDIALPNEKSDSLRALIASIFLQIRRILFFLRLGKN